MSRAFDRPHRGHVSRSDELLSAALRRGCRGRNRALLPFCTVIDTSTFRGRVARRGRSCFRCVPVCAPKTGRRYDQRRLAQFRCELPVYTRQAAGARSYLLGLRGTFAGLVSPAFSSKSAGFARVHERRDDFGGERATCFRTESDDPPRPAVRLTDELVHGRGGMSPTCPGTIIGVEGNTGGGITDAGTLPIRNGIGSHAFSVLEAGFDDRSRTAAPGGFGARRRDGQSPRHDQRDSGSRDPRTAPHR